MNAGFDQIFMLYSALVYSVADIIDTYVYRIGIRTRTTRFSTAAGLFKSVIAFVMILINNTVAKRPATKASGKEGMRMEHTNKIRTSTGKDLYRIQLHLLSPCSVSS